MIQKPLPIHGDYTITAVASYISRKYKDTILVFQTGEKRFIHYAADAWKLVAVTRTLRRA